MLQGIKTCCALTKNVQNYYNFSELNNFKYEMIRKLHKTFWSPLVQGQKQHYIQGILNFSFFDCFCLCVWHYLILESSNNGNILSVQTTSQIQICLTVSHQNHSKANKCYVKKQFSNVLDKIHYHELVSGGVNKYIFPLQLRYGLKDILSAVNFCNFYTNKTHLGKDL